MPPANLVKALDEITKQYGQGSISWASEVNAVPKIKSGVFSLDAFLGGGIPLSRMTLLTGEPSGGKSTISLLAAANAQRTDRNTYVPLEKVEGTYYRTDTGEVGEPMQVVYLDAEQSFDPSWAANLGVDNDALVYAPVIYQEQAFDMMVAMVRTGEVDLIILDSLAALAPSTELDQSTEDQQVGVSARVNNKGLRKLTGEFNRAVATRPHAPGIIFINQLREKVGVMFGNPETKPGGRGQAYFASLEVKVWPKALGKAIKDGEDIVGRPSTFKIQKNKLNGVHGEGEFTIYMRDFGAFRKGSTDEALQVVDWAERFDVIEKSGAWYTINGERMQGKNKVVEYLFSNHEAFDQVYRDTMVAIQEAYG